jgi:hypothetical protein
MSEIASKSEEQQLAEGEVDGFRRALGPFVVACGDDTNGDAIY